MGKTGNTIQRFTQRVVGDNFAIDLEVENISNIIKKDDCVLDVGCSNGHATLAMLQKNPVKLYGVDYAENMILYANENKSRLDNSDNVSFRVGDIKKLPFEDNFLTLYIPQGYLSIYPIGKSRLKVLKNV